MIIIIVDNHDKYAIYRLWFYDHSPRFKIIDTSSHPAFCCARWWLRLNRRSVASTMEKWMKKGFDTLLRMPIPSCKTCQAKIMPDKMSEYILDRMWRYMKICTCIFVYAHNDTYATKWGSLKESTLVFPRCQARSAHHQWTCPWGWPARNPHHTLCSCEFRNAFGPWFCKSDRIKLLSRILQTYIYIYMLTAAKRREWGNDP